MTGYFADLASTGAYKYMGTFSGCFTTANVSTSHIHSASNLTDQGMGDGIKLDPSLVSPIYVTNGTVRPNSLSVLVLLKL